MTSHILVIGETQSGKTFWANRHHMGGEGAVSVYYNTNHTDGVWGVKCHSLAEVVNALKAGQLKVNYLPHRGMEEPDWAQTRAELRLIIGFLFKHWSSASTRPAKVYVDEAQNFEQELQHLATMALGKRIQVVAITQYPVMVDTTSRSNMPTWVIFKTGFQMEKFFAGYGDAFPRAEIAAWTARPYHFATFDAQHGWRYHPPLTH